MMHLLYLFRRWGISQPPPLLQPSECCKNTSCCLKLDWDKLKSLIYTCDFIIRLCSPMRFWTTILISFKNVLVLFLNKILSKSCHKLLYNPFHSLKLEILIFCPYSIWLQNRQWNSTCKLIFSLWWRWSTSASLQPSKCCKNISYCLRLERDKLKSFIYTCNFIIGLCSPMRF